MAFPARIAIASRNAHKLREIGRICADWPVEWLTVENHDGPWPEVDETGGTYLENALLKAGEEATDERNLEELIRALKGVPGSGRTARYRCVAALAFPEVREVHAEGICEGTLVPKPRGLRGFGYDPIFVPAGWDRTMAELADEEKDRISHRGRALRALREALAIGLTAG